MSSHIVSLQPGSKCYGTLYRSTVNVVKAMNAITIREKLNMKQTMKQWHIDSLTGMNTFHILQYKPTAVSDKMATSVFSM